MLTLGTTTGHEQVGDHWESFEEIPVLAQLFTEMVFGLDPMEISGLFHIAIDPLYLPWSGHCPWAMS